MSALRLLRVLPAALLIAFASVLLAAVATGYLPHRDVLVLCRTTLETFPRCAP